MAESVVDTLSPEVYKEHIALISNAEKLIDTDPALLLRKIKWIVYRSYVYFALLLVLSIVLAIVAVGSFYYVHTLYVIYIAIAAFYVGQAVVKGLFFRVPDINANDYLLDLSRVPKFAKVFEKLSNAWKVKVDKVFISASPNAFALQRARLGIFGFYKNTVTIGLPVLLYLSSSELEAVLAHELGHISNNDSRDTGFINSVRIGWIRMIGVLNEKRRSAFLIRWYIQREWPRLDAYTFVYSRSQEKSADTFALSNSGKVAWPASLLKMHLLDYLNDDFWEIEGKRIMPMQSAPDDVYSQMKKFLALPISKEKLDDWIKSVAFRYTRAHDTHPSFTERLQAAGVHTDKASLEVLLQSGHGTALESDFGDEELKILEYFDKWKKKALADSWENIQMQRKATEEGIAALETADASDPKFWQYVGLKIGRDGILSVSSYIEKGMAKNSEDPTGLFLKAWILLEKGEEEGKKIMEKLVEDGKVSVQEAHTHIYKYLARKGNQEEAKHLDKSLQKESKKISDTNIENADLSMKDSLHSPDLPDEIKAQIIASAKKHSSIGAIYVARRELKNDPRIKNYVLAVYIKRLVFQTTSSSQELINEMVKEINFSGMMFVASGNLSSYGTKVQEVPGSEIYVAD
jgi:Zn-dependent protease with chaperone function